MINIYLIRIFIIQILFSLLMLSKGYACFHNDLYLYVGTYTDGNSKGIYLYKMNSETGALTFFDATDKVKNPSYLTIDKSNRYLYSVNETADFDEANNGSVSSFKINQQTRKLQFINCVSSGGAHPCYVTVDAAGKFVLAANYSGGNISVLPINEDGSLGDASDIAQHFGSSIIAKRQDKPHAHSVYLGPQNKFVYAVDLGIDKINIYKFDSEMGKVIENDPQFYNPEPGSGPRHMVFHQNNKFAYLINELSNSITALEVDEQTGGLKKIETYSSLPENFEGISYCADIHVHPNRKYLYGSNRGHNSIVIFEIDEETGKLSLIGHELTQGDWPRNFAIDPTGRFLLAANQKSNNVTVFRINEQTGSLIFTSISENIPSPVCLTFLN